METSDTQLPFHDVMINKKEKGLYGYLFKTNGLKKICLIQIKPLQALLEKYHISSSSENQHDG